MSAVVAERLNPSEAHKTYSTHKLVPSGSRTPLSRSRCTSGKSLFTSMRAAWPALMARDTPPSTGPFFCGGYGDCYSTPRTPSWCTRCRYPSGMPVEHDVANALLALACPPGGTRVARRDDPLLLRGKSRRPYSKWAPVLFRIISCFS